MSRSLRLLPPSVLSALVLAACGSSQGQTVPSLGGGTHTKQSASSATLAAWRAAVACVRQHGMPSVPDPVVGANGQVSVPGYSTTADLTPAARAACLLLGLGAIALLVGAVGIANVMVMAIIQRRKEIGLRRALGATRRHIAIQFTAEALILSALGGAAGLLAGLLITAGYAHARHWGTAIPTTLLPAALAAALTFGLIAGLYPAVRAARLSPTDALRATT